jgi:hypothetical protein
VGQGFVGGAGEFDLDVGEGQAGRLAALDRHDLEEVALAVERRAAAEPEWPVDQADRRIPPDGAGVGHLTDPTVGRAHVVGRERVRHSPRQLIQRPTTHGLDTVTVI